MEEVSETVAGFTMSAKTITMCIIVLILFVVGNIVFSIFTYVSMRDKQFEPCDEGSYRNTRS